LPQFGNISIANKKCPEDGLPMIMVKIKGKKPYSMCIDHNCKSKKDWGNAKKDKK